MKISNNGIELIKKYEGLKLAPYLCPALVPTIGYGSTRYENGTKVRITDPRITIDRAEKLLKNTLKKYENGVSKLVTANINQYQFDALVSFAYNLGVAALAGSTLLKKVNANPNDPDIEVQFNKWVKVGSKVLPGLVKRRADEAQLYFTK